MPKLNKRRLGVIARWLEAGAPERDGVVEFDMGHWVAPVIKAGRKCGTSCCLAGASCYFFSSRREGDKYAQARRLLGLTDDQAFGLFYACPGPGPEDVSPEMAAKVIRRLIKTGKVHWPTGMRK